MRTQPMSCLFSLFTPLASATRFTFVLTFGLAVSSHGADILLITDPVSLGNPSDPLAFDQELIDLL